MNQFLASALLKILSKMPWWFLRALAGFLGRLLFHLNGRETRNTRVNLKIAYSGLSEPEREKLVRSVLIESARTYLEMPRIWLSTESLGRRLDANGATDEARRLLALGKGLIVALPHMGNWEMAPQAIPEEVRITALYRPPRKAFFDPILKKMRSTDSLQLVPTTRAGLKALNQALSRGEGIAILPDQVPKASGSAAASAPFYGRESLTMTLLGRLAAKHQSPVMFICANRLDNGQYRIEHFVADSAIADKDPRNATIALNQAVQRCVEVSPAQYQWAYRRFEPVNDSQTSPYH